MSLNIVILAAGQGKRMYSACPKALHPLAGKPLLRHVLETARQLHPARLAVVYGYGGDVVRQAFSSDTDILWALQSEQRGTGHALAQALPLLDATLPTLTLYGDVPLVEKTTLERLLRQSGEDMGLLTVDLDHPQGYGRVVRDEQGRVRGIVEERDATDAERAITEINTGILLLPRGVLGGWLAGLKNENAQGEYYLTDVVARAASGGMTIHTTHPAAAWEVEGVNDQRQLAALERVHQRRSADRLCYRACRLPIRRASIFAGISFAAGMSASTWAASLAAKCTWKTA